MITVVPNLESFNFFAFCIDIVFLAFNDAYSKQNS